VGAQSPHFSIIDLGGILWHDDQMMNIQSLIPDETPVERSSQEAAALSAAIDVAREQARTDPSRIANEEVLAWLLRVASGDTKAPKPQPSLLTR
jgi:hypothetical protein